MGSIPAAFANLHYLNMRYTRENFLNKDGSVEAIELPFNIFGFFGKYKFLSNYHQEAFVVDDRWYNTSEAAYMACKTVKASEKAALSMTITGPEAKKIGRLVTLRPDWNNIKYACMYKVLQEKFWQSSSLCNKLLLTKGKYLEESNWYEDDYWGKCTSNGQNNLGKILMSIRDEGI